MDKSKTNNPQNGKFCLNKIKHEKKEKKTPAFDQS